MAKAQKLQFPVDVETAERMIKERQIPYDYDTKEYPIEVLLHKFNSDEPEKSTIIIPPYQRDFIWNESMKSRFIESLLLGVPIQPLFAAIIDENGALELIDGSQRLRTIDAFVHDEFQLSGLKKLSALNDFYYSDFTQARRNKFELINLRLHVITEKADLTVRQDIFDRINTSGVQANKSEVRKGAYAGSFYSFIMMCANDVLFQRLCPVGEWASKRGEAEELILRFFTYSNWGTDQKERGSKILDRYVIYQNEHEFDEKGHQAMFERMLQFVQKYFPYGFRKNATANSTPRVRFEAISVGVHFALDQDSTLVPSSMKWLQSNEFNEVTTSDSSGNPGRLTKRVNFVRDCLLNRIKDSELNYDSNEGGLQ